MLITAAFLTAETCLQVTVLSLLVWFAPADALAVVGATLLWLLLFAAFGVKNWSTPRADPQ